MWTADLEEYIINSIKGNPDRKESNHLVISQGPHHCQFSWARSGLVQDLEILPENGQIIW